MADAASITWNERRTRSRRTAYQRTLGGDMALHLSAGLICLFFPRLADALVGVTAMAPSQWVRVWGATIVLVTALYIPGLQGPLRSRYTNILGVVGHVWLSMIWFVAGGGFVWLGVVELILAVILGWLYYRYCIAVIMSRP